MKCVILLAAVLAICLVQANAEYDDEWAKFKVDFKREFDAEEDAERKVLFIATVKRVNEHNKLYDAGKESYSLGINHFADRKPEELKHSTGLKVPAGLAVPSDE